MPVSVFFAYQVMFAVITPALMTGAIADRMKFSAFAVFLGRWVLICYAPVAHWVFSPNGWLFKRGANGLFHGGGVKLLLEQLLAVAAALGYTGGASFVLAKVLDRVMGLRVEEEAEFNGLEQSEHAENAYAMTELGAMTLH